MITAPPIAAIARRALRITKDTSIVDAAFELKELISNLEWHAPQRAYGVDPNEWIKKHPIIRYVVLVIRNICCESIEDVYRLKRGIESLANLQEAEYEAQGI